MTHVPSMSTMTRAWTRPPNRLHLHGDGQRLIFLWWLGSNLAAGAETCHGRVTACNFSGFSVFFFSSFPCDGLYSVGDLVNKGSI